MENCKSTSTPSKLQFQLLVDEGKAMVDSTLYRSIVCVLQYLTFTRLDIAYFVNMVCQFMTNPSKLNFFLVKIILRYLQRTLHCGLTYTKTPNFQLNAYSNSN